MFKQEWKKVCAEVGILYDRYGEHVAPENQTLRLKSTRIADKGATGILIGANNHMASLRLDCGKVIRLTTGSLQRLTEGGEVEEVAPRDLLGEPIVLGGWVAYSQGRYRTGHDLAVGRVLAFTKRGTIEIAAKVKSGEKVKGSVTHLVNPERCVKLPVDVARLTMAIFTDFDSIDGSRD
jgi:hypothetical protein